MNERYRQEIEKLYREMYGLLFEYARSSMPNDSLAEEAVQDKVLQRKLLCRSGNLFDF